MRIRRLHGLALSVYIAFVPIAVAAQAVVIDYSESLQQLVFESSSAAMGGQKLANVPPDLMRFDAFGRQFEISLNKNPALVPAAIRQRMLEKIDVFRGEIAGETDSWVRLTIMNGVPRGMLWDGAEMYAIDAVDGETAIYRLADLRIADGTMSCAQVSVANNAEDFLKIMLAEASANTARVAGPGAISELDMAVIGDFEFSSDKGASAEADIVTRMNNIDGIFSMQLGVQLNVNQIDVFTSSDDPFTNESDANILIDEVADFRFATTSQNVNGLSHLFTGRELDGSTVGIAFGGQLGGALCNRRFGAGLTQATHSATFDSLIAAHELGHNFGAPHDGTENSACEATPQDFLMAPSLNGSNTFSSCSIMLMQDDVASASCISPLPGADIAVVANGAMVTALLGNSGVVTFDVNSGGMQDIDNVSVDVTIPANVGLESVIASAGTCSSGAGSANCALGTVAAGSGVTIMITVATPTVGSADFIASASADGDANANNNQASIRLNVEPAVDLVVVAAPRAEVRPNQSTIIRSGIENRATLPATNVTLTVVPSTGISIESASWDPGTCAIVDSIVTCQAASLAAQANDDLVIQVTGISAGMQSYTISVTAVEVDRDESNNDANGQVNVNAVVVESGNNGSGGSGAVSLTLLLLLGCCKLMALQRMRARR